MNRVIIESPYAPSEGRTVEDNTNFARWCLRHSLDHGEAPFASHLLYTQSGVLDDTDPRERERGLHAGYEWMATADIVAFYVDHGWSPGMIRALKVARLLQRKIEIRHCFGKPKVAAKPPLEVHTILVAAGVVRELPPPMPGVRAFTFLPKGGPR